MKITQRNLDIEPEVKAFILEHKGDLRLCTTCRGPMIMPVGMKGPKDSDIVMHIGPNKLYISKVQARYIKCIERHMIDHYKKYMEKQDLSV